MLTYKNHKPSCKVWIEYNGKPVLGKGGAEILKAITKDKETGAVLYNSKVKVKKEEFHRIRKTCPWDTPAMNHCWRT